MEKVRLGVIGLGHRGPNVLDVDILPFEDVEIVALCDLYADRVESTAKMIKERKGNDPFCTTDYHELLAREDVDAVYIPTAWEAHIEVAIAAMRAGKYVGMEVGGAYSVEDCWALVKTSEETGMPCMMLENCCYGQVEMMCLNMAKKGVFGKIVHCDGGYRHDLRAEIAFGEENRRYRLRNYIARNCDNYPTHQLGPICKLLNINRGNRLVSLVSIASKAEGLREYILKEKGPDDALANVEFAQGDVVTTIIKCAGGETITLTLDTTLPRAYSRGFVVCGTKGTYEEANNSIFLDADRDTYEGGEFKWKENWNNADKYAEKYNHPQWKGITEETPEKGHGRMDHLLFKAFFESIKQGKDFPIDVYDAATWACISALSEQSIAMGGMPVPIPDFTGGKWVSVPKKDVLEEYSLDTIPEL